MGTKGGGMKEGLGGGEREVVLLKIFYRAYRPVGEAVSRFKT